jgi:hypothetical protein
VPILRANLKNNSKGAEWIIRAGRHSIPSAGIDSAKNKNAF